ncbi:TetR family transcriptional regulator [Sphingobium naphthae]|uniref:TetR/AcrR family transcriptional regulator n=1 Tax=Sphingobium naphthae TaxID=1886786 RepID=A0ABU3ZZN7_9SPHN|nr:TetR family transcriptional regulator [Sphingobium naphthae]MEA3541337.1 TetR/AcrR family transcriptional regulator [Pseudomonadota bacterium]MCC4251278.1 TetR family transcriptional regulator [Sphingobium naphthae]MDV5824960.1 TetR/AcrR family transcriptional regulator [Sphingobium naphthae]MEC7932672.1 TetR/AcrR family transcriptional regulator [Pseudomonadota bacterium]MEC8036009.1 TetR/AcrR family transcriptional regulator [Pseudomonadota bacterium]
MAESALKKKENGRGTRATDAEETRFNILEVATAEFADKGLSGARIDEIAERTNSSKRMIYYYFGSKEGLYRAVLERAYTAVREVDADNRRDDLDPDAALRDVVGVTFDYHNQHPEFVRLVMNENILRGAHVGEVPGIRERNRKVIDQLRAILARGVASGHFREGVDPVELHMTISALCFYNVSNRYTFSFGFERDMSSPKALARRRMSVIDVIESWCRA